MKTTWMVALTLVVLVGCSSKSVDFDSGARMNADSVGGAGGSSEDAEGGKSASIGNAGRNAAAGASSVPGNSAGRGDGNEIAPSSTGGTASGSGGRGIDDPSDFIDCELYNGPSALYVDAALNDPEALIEPCPTDSLPSGACSLQHLNTTCVYYDQQPEGKRADTFVCYASGDTTVWQPSSHICRWENCPDRGGVTLPLAADCATRELVECAPPMYGESGEIITVSEGVTTIQERLDNQIQEAITGACPLAMPFECTVRFDGACPVEVSLSAAEGSEEAQCIADLLSSKSWVCARDLECSMFGLVHPF